ncbi:MAG: glycosyltransferase family 2 protein, partial [Pseudomonas sp.]
MNDAPYVSVLIPAKNEAENLPSLLQEISLALAAESFEVIVVDDGSTDDTVAQLLALKRNGYSNLRVLSHARSLGQSTSLYHAAQNARGTWLATLDGDGQNDPADIPQMLKLVRLEEGRPGGVKLVAGHRVNRQDSA